MLIVKCHSSVYFPQHGQTDGVPFYLAVICLFSR
nr:MAG TPA: hypothetical protein [Caudoviricetes sp.]